VQSMGVDTAKLYETGDMTASVRLTSGFLYIPNMMTSPIIHTQDEFVKPYGIQSEIGFSGMIADLNGKTTIYALFAFSRVPVNEQAANAFASMQPYLGTGLASLGHHTGVFAN
jgi:hypothetical protein